MRSLWPYSGQLREMTRGIGLILLQERSVQYSPEFDVYGTLSSRHELQLPPRENRVSRHLLRHIKSKQETEHLSVRYLAIGDTIVRPVPSQTVTINSATICSSKLQNHLIDFCLRDLSLMHL